jgi:hypothetical protein
MAAPIPIAIINGVEIAPVVTPPADVVQPVMEQQPTGPVLTRKAGFANNKFYWIF